MMWTIKHIFDGEYGCEECGSSPMLLITLVNELGEEKAVKASDAWLTEKGLDVGSVWGSDPITKVLHDVTNL